MYIHIHAHMVYAHTHTYMYTLTHRHTCICRLSHLLFCTSRPGWPREKHMQIQVSVSMCYHRHECTQRERTRARARTHTHTHTHKFIRVRAHVCRNKWKYQRKRRMWSQPCVFTQKFFEMYVLDSHVRTPEARCCAENSRTGHTYTCTST
jgi:hypothetical protein